MQISSTNLVRDADLRALSIGEIPDLVTEEGYNTPSGRQMFSDTVMA